MRCVTPMYREYIEYTPEQKARLKEQGTKQYQRIVPRKEVMEELTRFPNQIRTLEQINEDFKKNGSPLRWQTIPCRHCYACQLSYSAEWATRITCETSLHGHNYYVTLTYQDNWLPIADKISVPIKDHIKTNGEWEYTWKDFENDGTIQWNEGTVWEPHIHNFLHDLRQHLARHKKFNGLKYFYCMEYGSETHRPHAHLILMNCPLDINQFYDFHLDERKKLHWKTPEIEHLWGETETIDGKRIFHQYGMIDVAEVEWSCAAYVARYCMKKLHEKTGIEYAQEGKLPEFVRMSRNIGREWYKQHKDEIYYTDSIVMKTVKGSTGNINIPKAWDRIFEEEHPEQMAILKESRKQAAQRSAELERQLSDYSDLKMLELKEKRIATISKQLPRAGDW